MTYGNNSSSKVNHSQLSLTPITVFLPSAGEVRIYREGKLLSIQSFPMGNFEVDTAPLPFSIYQVEVEVVIDGKVHAKQTQTVNKTFKMKVLLFSRSKVKTGLVSLKPAVMSMYLLNGLEQMFTKNRMK
ncbi:TcfC E-set like domain-containing protein [Proteus terrae]|uniref:TcfC E-set like domain-containing protein n=1 Tax=Proteus terrae TaxID=1574161 RepID=UPI003BA194F4